MPEEGFLRRWARVKASGADAVAEAAPAAAPVAPPAPITVAPQAPGVEEGGAVSTPTPTLAEAAQLTPASDFSSFVGQGVDQDVRRLALKKLFSDPHFHVMDRLDMYMDDYNKPDPVSAAMLAGLEHARGVLRRPEEVQAELARLAALDPPEHAAGVVKTVKVEAPAADEAADAAADAGADAGAGEPARAVEAAPEEQDADSPGPFDPVPDAVAGAEPAAAPRAPAGAAPSSDADKDAIALTIVRAHNGEARA